MHSLSDDISTILRCPYCSGALAGVRLPARAEPAKPSFRFTDGRPDLRLRRPIQRTTPFAVGSDRPAPEDFRFMYPMPKSQSFKFVSERR